MFWLLSGKIPKIVGATLCHKTDTYLIFFYQTKTAPNFPRLILQFSIHISNGTHLSWALSYQGHVGMWACICPSRNLWLLGKAKPPEVMFEPKKQELQTRSPQHVLLQRRVSMSPRKISEQTAYPGAWESWAFSQAFLLRGVSERRNVNGVAYPQVDPSRPELYSRVLYFVSSEAFLCSLPGWALQWQDSSLLLRKFSSPKQN